MFTVTATRREPQLQPGTSINGSVQPRKTSTSIAAPEEFGLKPMNCPGHCILFQSERRSYKDLPIRYADFSPLHRNEISGALSGLTRVRRFHQDDGHIFCRPNQVKAEISKSLDFIKLVHQTLNLSDYRLVLSTRPKDNYIGTLAEWDRAEDQLKQALDDTGAKWRTQQGDGAFYGPKIDVILNDSDGKEHQTATIQLDFQLPKRFELVYDAPAPEMEALGTPDKDPKLRRYKGKVTPVMIHRAALGSIERFMALLLERHKGRLPFWLSPKQVIILTVTDHAPVIEYARNLEKFLSTAGEDRLPKQLHRPTYIVHVDDSGDTLNRKFVRAKQEMYNMICVVGNRNMKAQDEPNNMYSGTVDVDINAQPDQLKTWTAIEKIKPGSQAPIKKDRGVGSKLKGYPVVRLTGKQCRRLIEVLDNNYL